MKTLLIFLLLLVVPAYATNDIYNGLAGWWTFDSNDILGTSVTDKSGNNDTGTTHGSPSSIAGKLGQALSFNGSTQYISLADIPESGSFTISCWALLNAYTSVNPIPCVSRAHFGGLYPQNYFISLRSGTGTCSTHDWLFQMSDNGGDIATACSNVIAVLNQWTLLTGVYKSSSRTLTLYINGVAQSTTGNASALASTYYTSTETTNIATYDTNASPFSGNVDDVRLYNRALSAAEI